MHLRHFGALGGARFGSKRQLTFIRSAGSAEIVAVVRSSDESVLTTTARLQRRIVSATTGASLSGKSTTIHSHPCARAFRHAGDRPALMMASLVLPRPS